MGPSKVIRMSKKNPNHRDVRFGEGVYFTTLSPAVSKTVIVRSDPNTNFKLQITKTILQNIGILTQNKAKF
jgi:hypothetical protein